MDEEVRNNNVKLELIKDYVTNIWKNSLNLDKIIVQVSKTLII